MNNFKILVIHVGTMANKGTQALVKSEFRNLMEYYKNPEISVSTTDVPGVKKFGPRYKHVTPPLIDIPYEKSDEHAKKCGYGRDNIRYKFHLIYSLIIYVLQIPCTLISACLLKIGLKPFCKSVTLNCMRESDLIISTSDENFKEGSSNLPLKFFWLITWWLMLFSRMWDVLIAKKVFNKTIIVFPNSVGPFRTIIGKFMGRVILKNVDVILVREEYSLKAIETLKLKKLDLTLTSDIALLFRESQNTTSFKVDKDCIAVCPGYYSGSLSPSEKNNYILSHSTTLDKLIDIYGVRVYFIPHYISGFSNDDMDISKQIIDKMTNKNSASIIEVYTADEFRFILGQVNMVITSKMHPGVLALTKYTPTFAVAYDYKQSGLFDQLEISKHSIFITDLEPDAFYKKLEVLWLERDSVSKLLSRKIPKLQDNVKRNLNRVLLQFGWLKSNG